MPQDDFTVGLRDHLESKIDALSRYVELKFTAMEQRADLEQVAVRKAEQAMANRLEGLNELRGAMRDQTGQFLTREAFEVKHDVLIGRLGVIENRIANFDGRTAVLVTVVALIVSLLVAWLARR